MPFTQSFLVSEKQTLIINVYNGYIGLNGLAYKYIYIILFILCTNNGAQFTMNNWLISSIKQIQFRLLSGEAMYDPMKYILFYLGWIEWNSRPMKSFALYNLRTSWTAWTTTKLIFYQEKLNMNNHVITGGFKSIRKQMYKLYIE